MELLNVTLYVTTLHHFAVLSAFIMAAWYVTMEPFYNVDSVLLTPGLNVGCLSSTGSKVNLISQSDRRDNGNRI